MSTKELLIQSLIDEGVLKTSRIIEAFRAVDRADFVPEKLRDEAYSNYPLPIGYGQTISQPLTVAFMLELLQPQPEEKILDIGSGSAWTTALLAYIVSGDQGGVLGIERILELCVFGQKNLAKYFDESRSKIICGDGKSLVAGGEQFDKILSGATALKAIPIQWRELLKTGGRIAAPIDNSVWLFIKKSAREWEEKEYPGFIFVPLR